MTYEDLVKANESIKTMTISRFDKKKGVEVSKEYAEVNQRIKAFRMVFPNGQIRTEFHSLNDGLCVMRAYVYDEDGKCLATGTAYEKETSSQINQTSYIENCETSAIGRALGIAGFGIDTSVASYEEVKNAINQQETTEKKIDDAKVATLVEQAKQNGVPIEYIIEGYKVESLSDLTVGNFMQITKNWKKIAESWSKKNASERND